MDTEDAEVEKLLKRVEAGDQEAWDLLVQLHRIRLLRKIHLRLDPRVTARGDPEDILQQAYQEAWRRLPEYLKNRPLPFYPWLRRLVLDQILKFNGHHFRDKRSPEREVPPLPEDSSVQFVDGLMGDGPTPSKEFAAKELAEKLRLGLSQLDGEDQELLLSHYFEDVPIREVAHILGVSPDAAYQRHSRSLKRLRKILQNLGVSSA